MERLGMRLLLMMCCALAINVHSYGTMVSCPVEYEWTGINPLGEFAINYVESYWHRIGEPGQERSGTHRTGTITLWSGESTTIPYGSEMTALRDGYNLSEWKAYAVNRTPTTAILGPVANGLTSTAIAPTASVEYPDTYAYTDTYFIASGSHTGNVRVPRPRGGDDSEVYADGYREERVRNHIVFNNESGLAFDSDARMVTRNYGGVKLNPTDGLVLTVAPSPVLGSYAWYGWTLFDIAGADWDLGARIMDGEFLAWGDLAGEPWDLTYDGDDVIRASLLYEYLPDYTATIAVNGPFTLVDGGVVPVPSALILGGAGLATALARLRSRRLLARQA